ncbi:MAG TPA: ABC transporter ATP-binding protein [Ardenticatenaceae bacterium]|nr:ABC transporter ATP-binding protein [Ardenticatenaceae bacterium]
MPDVLLEIEDLTMRYRTRAGEVSAVEDVSLTMLEGESLGLVGESGSGKTSLANTILKLLPENAEIKSGKIIFKGVDLVPLAEDEIREYRWRDISMIFQAAMNALNPVYTVADQIVEAMNYHLGELEYEQARGRVAELFELVGIDPKMMDRYPHEYSGGMRQRAIIAMALSCVPDLVIADEPTTALDVIVQDKLLRKMMELQKRLGMSMIYISHDIAVIAEVCERIGVMYAGQLAELGSAEAIFHRPVHHYTAGLLSSFPSIVGPKRELRTIPGEPPNLLKPPTGCRFHPRCPAATRICREEVPPFRLHGPGHFAACWHPVGGG